MESDASKRSLRGTKEKKPSATDRYMILSVVRMLNSFLKGIFSHDECYLRYQVTYDHLISYHPYSQLQRADVFVEEFTVFLLIFINVLKTNPGVASYVLLRYVVSLLQVSIHC